MKRLTVIISFLFVFVTALLGFSFNTQAADGDKIQLGTSSTYYSYDSQTKTLTISGTGATPNFTNSIGASNSQPWYDLKTNNLIDNIIVEEGVTSLGNCIFQTVNAENVQLPSTLTRIGGSAFNGNTALKSIDLKNVETVYNNAFYMCLGLEKIYIPESVKSIGASAFEQCTALNSVEFAIQKMTLTVSRQAFLGCPKLKTVSVPRNATLGAYSFGFEKAVAGKYYDGFVMNVYRDSKAYTYASEKYPVSYTLIDEMELCRGDVITRTYYSDTVDDKMIFTFTPDATANYSFLSSGSLDVDCVLIDKSNNDEIVYESKDNSIFDLNFTVECQLTAGHTYHYVVTSNDSDGDFTVEFMSVGITDVAIDWDINLISGDYPDGTADISALITGMGIDFTYADGFVHTVPFEEGGEYGGMTFKYSDKLKSHIVCGKNNDSITVGDRELNFTVNVEHTFVSVAVDPTVTEDGYTRHTCTQCGYAYTSDFVPSLGTTVYGYVRVMASPDGDIIENSFVPYADIFDYNGNYVCTTDENGFFVAYNAYDFLTVRSDLGPERRVEIDTSDGNLGDIGVVHCDINGDGYVNAKDFAIIRSAYGKYDESNLIIKSIDVNGNGLIDSGDWEHAKSFLAYGKIDESIYDIR